MGKAAKWFRSIFRSKKPISTEKSNHTQNKTTELKTSIGSTKRSNLDGPQAVSDDSNFVEELDANKHAIAVAVATAAVAEAAVAAARAAAEVVRLTSGGSRNRGGDSDRLRELAAIKIQSAFRAYLARKALKALRGLVKLQALVRGRIVRKQSADMLRRMQAMARIQARACATRGNTSDSPDSHNKLGQNWHPGNETSKGYDLRQHPGTFKHEEQNLKKSGSRSNVMNHNVGERTYLPSNWLDRWMEECTWINQQSASFKHKCGDDEKSDKILEVDTWKPHQNPRRTGKPLKSSQYFSAWNDSAQGRRPLVTDSTNSARYQNPDPSFSSGDVSSIKSLKVPPEADKLALWTAENSPHVHSASSRPGSSKRRNMFSPVRSEGGKSFYGDYLSYPNYMANTESYRAKVRSQSAPKQRSQLDNFTTSRQFMRGPWDSDSRSEKDSTLHFSYQSKGYSGSPQLSKQGMPVPDNSGRTHSR